MTDRPNLLFLFSDQHSQKIAGCYGDPIIQTPNLDKLASTGVVFDNAYCPSPLCVPSRMSLLTGRYPYQQEVWMNDDFLASDIPTFAHSLGAAGCQPTLIGRLHSIGPDQLHGYVDRRVGDHSPNWIGVARHDMGILKGAAGPGRATIEKSGTGQSAYEVKDFDTTAAAVNYFETKNKNNPFCVTVGFMLPHAPYVASKADFDVYNGRIGMPAIPPPRPEDEHPWLHWWRQKHNIVEVPEQNIIRTRAAYYALVTSLDRMIGRIMDVLECKRLLDNTLVIYASDHGDHIGERGLWWKHTFYDESVKIPLILSMPGRVPSGERRQQVVNLVDLNATILDALEAPPLQQSMGRSLMGVAQDNGADWTNLTYSEYCSDQSKWDGMRQRMVRKDNWKLIYYHGYPPQLFNLSEDPDELNDLSSNISAGEILDELMTLVLRNWNPDSIESTQKDRMKDKHVIGQWARETLPDNNYLWPLMPDMNKLD